MAVIKKQNSYMGLPMNIARGNPVPLDKTEIWYSRTEMENYAKTSVVAYVGQIVQLVDETNRTATAYIIANTAGDLLEVGSSTLGDNKSIELTEGGILRLVGAENAEQGAQLVMGENGVITWVKPDTNTVTGMQTAIANLENTQKDHGNRLTEAESDIDDLEAKVSSLGNILNFVGVKSVEDFANIKAEDYDVGDVFIVAGKELVCVEIDGVKTWESLGDPEGVTELQGRVQTLETWKTSANSTLTTATTDIANLQTSVSNLTDKDTELQTAINGKADALALATAEGKIKANEDNIKTLQGSIEGVRTTVSQKADVTYVDNKVSDINTAIEQKADKSVVNEIQRTAATKSELEEGLQAKVNLSDYNTKMTALTTADSLNSEAIAAVKTTADQNKIDIAGLKTSVSNKADASTVNDLATRVGQAETTLGAHTTKLNGLEGTVTGLDAAKADKTAVTELEKKVTANTEAIAAHAQEYVALEGRVTKAEGDITKAQGDATQALADALAASTAAAAAQEKGQEALNKANEILGSTEDGAEANTVYGAKAAAAVAKSAAETAQSEVDALENVVSALDEAYKTADANLDSRLDTIESVIGGVQGAMHFVGISTIDPAQGNTVAIEGKDDYSPVNGDVVIYKDAANNSIEYIYSDGSWVELGDVSAEAKRIEELESRMDAAEVVTAKVPTIESNILAIQTAASNLEARVKANEDAISEHATAAAALATRVGALETDLATTAADLRKELAAEASARAAAITAETTAREAAVSNLQGQIDTINGRLTWNKMGSVSSD